MYSNTWTVDVTRVLTRRELATVLADAADDPNVSYQLAKCCRALGETEAARKHYERAVDLAPRRIEWRYDFATFLHSLETDNARREALVECETILRQYPGWGPAANLRATLLSELNIRNK